MTTATPRIPRLTPSIVEVFAAAAELDALPKSRLIDYDTDGHGKCRLCDYTHRMIVPRPEAGS